MGDKPGTYWDFREAAWVRHRAAIEVPEQANPAAVPPDAAPPVAADQEADVRSG